MSVKSQVEVDKIRKQFGASIGHETHVWLTPIFTGENPCSKVAERLYGTDAESSEEMMSRLAREIGKAFEVRMGQPFTEATMIDEKERKKCCCGAAKTGMKDYGPGHSDWCDVVGKTQ